MGREIKSLTSLVLDNLDIFNIDLHSNIKTDNTFRF
ncbi:protein of unknown function [Mesotoga infera]|uniref:Uncharacterized protein n=1 Tax=Mesotoga infera TaxID=1236046 RepID=A0A7Z7LCG6_9BACT|nr:protein of unknown function [Mesotoga infera]